MLQNNTTSVRQMLEQLTTDQLDEMLQAELANEQPDDNAVRIILDILKERESALRSDMTPELEQAWAKYLQDTKSLNRTHSRRRRVRVWAARAVSVAAILVLVISLVPQPAGAESFWEKLFRWTDSFFEFLVPNRTEDVRDEYIFQTDNPGLQEVYDAVVAIGITEPVVPMWIPEGYELVECKTTTTPAKTYVYARFSNGAEELTINVNQYKVESKSFYPKDDTTVTDVEINGRPHSVMRNVDLWVAVWTIDNIECSIFVDCQEDSLHRILRSIYMMEDD